MDMDCVRRPMLHFLLILYLRGLSLVLKTLTVPQDLEQHPLTHGTWEGERSDSLSLGKNWAPTAGQRGILSLGRTVWLQVELNKVELGSRACLPI